MPTHRCKAVPLCFDYWLLLAELFSQESIKSCIRKFEFETLSQEQILPSNIESYDLTLDAAAQDYCDTSCSRIVEPSETANDSRSGKE